MSRRDYLFLKLFPNLIDYVQTDQFKYSEILLDKRYELGFTLREMAEIAGKTPDEYINLEYGENYISVNEYKKALISIVSVQVEELLKDCEQYDVTFEVNVYDPENIIVTVYSCDLPFPELYSLSKSLREKASTKGFSFSIIA